VSKARFDLAVSDLVVSYRHRIVLLFDRIGQYRALQSHDTTFVRLSSIVKRRVLDVRHTVCCMGHLELQLQLLTKFQICRGC
jgi:hypothetical protein